MNNLPNTFEGLLLLLRELREECTDPDFKTFDAKLLGEKIDALLEQYDVKAQKEQESK